MMLLCLHVIGAEGLKEYEDAFGPIIDCNSLLLKNELEGNYVIVYESSFNFSITRTYLFPHVFAETTCADYLAVGCISYENIYYMKDLKRFNIVDVHMSENINRVTKCDVQWRVIRHNGITKLKPETSECCVTAYNGETTNNPTHRRSWGGCDSYIEVQDAHLIACCDIHGKCKIDRQMSKLIREVLNPGKVFVLYFVMQPGLYVKFGNSCLHNARRRQNTYGPTRNHTFLRYSQYVVCAHGFKCLDNYINYKILRKGSSSPLVTFIDNIKQH